MGLPARAAPEVADLAARPRALRPRVRLRATPTPSGPVRGRARGVPQRQDAVRLQGLDLLEDDGGHGRRGVRAALQVLVRAGCSSSSSTGSTGCTSRRTAPRSTRSRSAARSRSTRDGRSTTRWCGWATCPASRPARRDQLAGATRSTASRSSRTGARGPMPKRACSGAARTSTTWCSPSPSAMARHVCGELIEDRPEWREMVDQRSRRSRPVAPDLAPRRRAGTRLGPPGCNDQRRTRSRSARGRRCHSCSARKRGPETTGRGRSRTSAGATHRGRHDASDVRTSRTGHREHTCRTRCAS